MSPQRSSSIGELFAELRMIGRRAVQVWRRVPPLQKWALRAAALLILFTSISNTVIPLLLGRLVDEVNRLLDRDQAAPLLYRHAAWILGILGVIYLLRELLQVGRVYLVEGSCTRTARQLSVQLVARILKADLASLSEEKIGTLQGRLQRGINSFVQLIRLVFVGLLPALLTGVFALTAALFHEPWLGLAMLGVVPLSLGLTLWQLHSQKDVRLQMMRSWETMDGAIVEQLHGIETVRIAHTHQHELGRVRRTAERRRRVEMQHHIQLALFSAAKALNEGLFHIVVLALAVGLVCRGTLSLGAILTFSILFYNVMAPLNEIHRILDQAHEASLQVRDLLKLQTQPIDRSFTPLKVQEPVVVPGAPLLAVHDLHVEYGESHGRRCHALKGISVEIRHGETVGIAGRSGSGKSTFLRVLLRLTHPTRGGVQIGGVPVEAVSREAIGRLVGYAGPHPCLFAGRIAQNIAYGCGPAALADVERAAELACVHEEIVRMPDGYRAVVAERGQNFSDGQKQRLALARIFLKDPPLMILDEGTSAVDNISEYRIQQALAAVRMDRTVILVAHRLSSLRHADRILVFDAGRIVETGTFTELAKRGGVFSELLRCATEPATAQGIMPVLDGVPVRPDWLPGAEAPWLTAKESG